jgi:hypothetical protein
MGNIGGGKKKSEAVEQKPVQVFSPVQTYKREENRLSESGGRRSLGSRHFQVRRRQQSSVSQFGGPNVTLG